jgi:hypothetical protein
MAEFVDVLRQFDRMCKANAGCFNCPLHEQDGVSDRCSIGAFVNDSERIEREVMKWAAEHPEPVYPTWGDYITMIMLEDITHRNDNNPQTLGQWMNKTHIPADLAKKLGLQPKEGT